GEFPGSHVVCDHLACAGVVDQCGKGKDKQNKQPGVTAKSGGKFRNTGGYYVNGKLRRLTVRECARLMGFPDSFQLNCSETQAYKLLGNSVVVDVIEYIFLSIAEALKKVDAI
ncbi:MAG: DNA cytosine methyltransferase, partial [Acutalibacteraceae bacterium]